MPKISITAQFDEEPPDDVQLVHALMEQGLYDIDYDIEES